MKTNELFEIALRFREAIEEIVRAGEIREICGFPTGCCVIASDLLQRYLIEQGVFTWYVSGKYGYGWDNGESHAWLETQDGIVIDITGDQYKYKKLRFTKPVYVGPRNDGFHEKFVLAKPVAYYRDNDPLVTFRKQDVWYDIVIRHMKGCKYKDLARKLCD